MKSTRLILSLCALVFGFGILALSLTTATAAQSSTGYIEASTRQLYWDDEVLPDHVVYPMLMAIDRVKLESASPTERVYLQIEYAHRRLEYAQALVEKDNKPLALTTATKGYKYLLMAGQEAMDQKMPPSVLSTLIKALEYQSKELTTFKAQFSDSDRAVLDLLQEQSKSLQNQLSSQVQAQS